MDTSTNDEFGRTCRRMYLDTRVYCGLRSSSYEVRCIFRHETTMPYSARLSRNVQTMCAPPSFQLATTHVYSATHISFVQP